MLIGVIRSTMNLNYQHQYVENKKELKKDETHSLKFDDVLKEYMKEENKR